MPFYFVEGEYFAGVVPFLRCGSVSFLWYARLVVVCVTHTITEPEKCVFNVTYRFGFAYSVMKQSGFRISPIMCVLCTSLLYSEYHWCICRSLHKNSVLTFSSLCCIRLATTCGFPSFLSMILKLILICMRSMLNISFHKLVCRNF